MSTENGEFLSFEELQAHLKMEVARIVGLISTNYEQVEPNDLQGLIREVISSRLGSDEERFSLYLFILETIDNSLKSRMNSEEWFKESKKVQALLTVIDDHYCLIRLVRAREIKLAHPLETVIAPMHQRRTPVRREYI